MITHHHRNGKGQISVIHTWNPLPLEKEKYSWPGECVPGLFIAFRVDKSREQLIINYYRREVRPELPWCPMRVPYSLKTILGAYEVVEIAKKEAEEFLKNDAQSQNTSTSVDAVFQSGRQ